MNRLLLALLFSTLPTLTNAAEINIDLGGTRIETPGMTITFGTRDRRGYYWDGYVYRDPDYWRRHQGPRGERYYTGHPGRDDRNEDHKGHHHCPPGQAKKGNC